MPYHIKKFGSRFKVVDDKGREYSKQGLTKAKARAQQKALYATAFHGSGFCCYSDDDGHHVLLEGGGIFSDVFAKAKRIASAAVSSVTCVDAPPPTGYCKRMADVELLFTYPVATLLAVNAKLLR